MGTTSSTCAPASRSQPLTLLQKSKHAEWQSAHPNPLRLVLGVDLPDAMPEDVDEIKTAFGEYEHKLDGSIDFDDDSDGDSRPSLMFGGDFSDGEDDDSEHSDLDNDDDSAFVIPTDFEDGDSFTAGGDATESVLSEETGDVADEPSGISPATLVGFEAALRAIASDFSGNARGSSDVSSGVAENDSDSLLYPDVCCEAVLLVGKSRFHKPVPSLVQARPIFSATDGLEQVGSSDVSRSVLTAKPAGATNRSPVAYRFEVFNVADSNGSEDDDALQTVFILNRDCRTFTVDGDDETSPRMLELVDTASGKTVTFGLNHLNDAFQKYRQLQDQRHTHGLEDETKSESKLVEAAEWPDFVKGALQELQTGGVAGPTSEETQEIPASLAVPSALLSFAPLVTEARFLGLAAFSMVDFETTLFAATMRQFPLSIRQGQVSLQPLAPASDSQGSVIQSSHDDPLQTFGGSGSADLTDGRGAYLASSSSQPPLTWLFKGAQTHQYDLIAFNTSVYMIDEVDGQRYLLGTVGAHPVDVLRSQGHEFRLHHVKQYTIGVEVDSDGPVQLPFQLVDDADGTGALCISGLSHGAELTAEELAESTLHMVRAGDHVVRVNGKDVKYAYDVFAALRQARENGEKNVPFVCAGIRNTSVLSLLNVNRFRGRAVEQLKQLVVDSFSNIRDQIQHHDSTDVDSWHRHLHAMHSQLTDIVNIADKVLSLSTRRGLDASQIFWWVQQRAKAFYREGSEFRHAIRTDSGIGDIKNPVDLGYKLQWAHAAVLAFEASLREYRLLESLLRREFVRRRKFNFLEKCLEAEVECLDLLAYFAVGYAKTSAQQSVAERQQFGTMPPSNECVSAFAETTLERRSRVWYLLRELVQLHETYRFDDSSAKLSYSNKMALVENAIRVQSKSPHKLSVIGRASLGMRTEDIREF